MLDAEPNALIVLYIINCTVTLVVPENVLVTTGLLVVCVVIIITIKDRL